MAASRKLSSREVDGMGLSGDVFPHIIVDCALDLHYGRSCHTRCELRERWNQVIMCARLQGWIPSLAYPLKCRSYQLLDLLPSCFGQLIDCCTQALAYAIRNFLLPWQTLAAESTTKDHGSKNERIFLKRSALSFFGFCRHVNSRSLLRRVCF